MALGEESVRSSAPLADRMRPQALEEVVGQPALTDSQSMLSKAISAQKPYSMILWGPPGCGKTTIARVAARSFSLNYASLNAVTDGVAQLREVIASAEKSRGVGEKTLLFIDEIARWSSSQQDALLPYVEDGTIILVGATTEHPGHRLQPALRSRLKVERLEAVPGSALKEMTERALASDAGLKGMFTITPEAQEELIHFCGGDVRALLTGLESAALVVGPAGGEIDLEALSQALGERSLPSGRTESAHLISAFIKSIRGSDQEAALYWMARLEASGEDPLYVARRLVISASEEVGSPGALMAAVSAYQSTQILGSPECWIPLAATTVYLAGLPKNWEAYQGLQQARSLVEEHDAYPVPLHLKSGRTEVDRDQGHGKGYRHPMDGTSGLGYLPPEIQQILRTSGR